MSFTKANNNTSTSKQRIIISSIILISFPLLLLSLIFSYTQLIDVICLQTTHLSTQYPSPNKSKHPKWLETIRGAELKHQSPLKVGLINFESAEQSSLPLGGIAQYVIIDFEPVSQNVTWKTLFPEWINEKPSDKCPTIPMPEQGKYLGLDVVVAKLPCGGHLYTNNRSRGEGVRDVHRLQVSLATARIIVENGVGKDGDVYVVFFAQCEPMVEIFRCNDLVWHGGSYWVYKPQVEKLKQLVMNMPIGTCQLAHHPYSQALGRTRLEEKPMLLLQDLDYYDQIAKSEDSPRSNKKQREAYVTVLHPSETYVCGAIALERSILQTNTTKDLVLLADNSISDHSIKGLQAAGWIIKRINRIRNPNAKLDAYNKWNYSKLRVWQLIEYDKVMFIDSDFIVLHNIDHFFKYPQLSVVPNDKWLFSSGIMLLEPSECFFKHLMSKRYTLKSYNGGDQGYLNEVLTWWHRLTRNLSLIKFYGQEGGNRLFPKDRYTIHYLGFKPWLCYRDYDCNWDRQDHHKFASDDVHAMWWRVYDDAIPKELRHFCGLTKELKKSLHIRRLKAQKFNLYDGHWKIEIKDPRQHI